MCPILRHIFWMSIYRSEEHTSELQSQSNVVCRLLLEKKNTADADPQAGGYGELRPLKLAAREYVPWLHASRTDVRESFLPLQSLCVAEVCAHTLARHH